ncbi:hypothetical protein M0802_002884 [Mischocyttarus mexicanus]|nr:hypothetical protein M0802_002884 [Mischocyttarus mexicanus]
MDTCSYGYGYAVLDIRTKVHLNIRHSKPKDIKLKRKASSVMCQESGCVSRARAEDRKNTPISICTRSSVSQFTLLSAYAPQCSDT